MVDNGALAVRAATETRYDVILMDVQMPVLDGLSAIRAIRDHERTAGRSPVPILTLTANAMPDHATRSTAAGADGHLTKPIRAATLLSAVTRAVDAPG